MGQAGTEIRKDDGGGQGTVTSKEYGGDSAAKGHDKERAQKSAFGFSVVTCYVLPVPYPRF